MVNRDRVERYIERVEERAVRVARKRREIRKKDEHMTRNGVFK